MVEGWASSVNMVSRLWIGRPGINSQQG